MEAGVAGAGPTGLLGEAPADNTRCNQLALDSTWQQKDNQTSLSVVVLVVCLHSHSTYIMRIETIVVVMCVSNVALDAFIASSGQQHLRMRHRVQPQSSATVFRPTSCLHVQRCYCLLCLHWSSPFYAAARGVYPVSVCEACSQLLLCLL